MPMYKSFKAGFILLCKEVVPTAAMCIRSFVVGYTVADMQLLQNVTTCQGHTLGPQRSMASQHGLLMFLLQVSNAAEIVQSEAKAKKKKVILSSYLLLFSKTQPAESFAL